MLGDAIWSRCGRRDGRAAARSRQVLGCIPTAPARRGAGGSFDGGGGLGADAVAGEMGRTHRTCRGGASRGAEGRLARDRRAPACEGGGGGGGRTTGARGWAGTGGGSVLAGRLSALPQGRGRVPAGLPDADDLLLLSGRGSALHGAVRGRCARGGDRGGGAAFDRGAGGEARAVVRGPADGDARPGSATGSGAGGGDGPGGGGARGVHPDGADRWGENADVAGLRAGACAGERPRTGGGGDPVHLGHRADGGGVPQGAGRARRDGSGTSQRVRDGQRRKME